MAEATMFLTIMLLEIMTHSGPKSRTNLISEKRLFEGGDQGKFRCNPKSRIEFTTRKKIFAAKIEALRFNCRSS